MDINDPDIRSRLEESALVGELTRTLIHEVNNFLNTFLLQIAMTDAAGPDSTQAHWATLGQQARALAALIQSWQRKRQTRAEPPRPCDLNPLLRDCVRNALRDSPIDLDLVAGPLPVNGSALDWHHLCLFLAQCALARRENLGLNEGSIVIQTQRNQQHVILRVCDRGPSLPDQALADHFDQGRNVHSGLELATCKYLAHRLEAKLQAVNHPRDGLVIVVDTLAADL